jgi:hypothetical protein
MSTVVSSPVEETRADLNRAEEKLVAELRQIRAAREALGDSPATIAALSRRTGRRVRAKHRAERAR